MDFNKRIPMKVWDETNDVLLLVSKVVFRRSEYYFYGRVEAVRFISAELVSIIAKMKLGFLPFDLRSFSRSLPTDSRNVSFRECHCRLEISL